LLSDTQKEWLQGKTLFVWDWLSDAKKFAFLVLRGRYIWIVRAAVLLEGIYVAWLAWSATSFDYSGIEDVLYVIGIGTIIAAVSLWCGLSIIRLTLRARSLGGIFMRALLFGVLSLSPALLLLQLASPFTAYVLPWLLPDEPTLSIAIRQLLTVMVIVMSVHCTVITLISGTVVALPIIFVYALTTVLFVSEFVVRRAAEHPKSLLTGSAVLGAIAVFLKMFR
jgi:hypothetical protein